MDQARQQISEKIKDLYREPSAWRIVTAMVERGVGWRFDHPDDHWFLVFALTPPHLARIVLYEPGRRPLAMSFPASDIFRVIQWLRAS